MRLAGIFLATLAVSVILSSTATWGLTYTTSCRELQDMSGGFRQLAQASMDEFGQLVRQLIGESGDLVSGILGAAYERSVAQMNETGLQFLQTTKDLMLQAKNTTAQTQGSVVAILLSCQAFMQAVISNFKAVGTDSASSLRAAAASRAQAAFHTMLEGCIQAIQRQAQLYQWGMLNLTRRPDEPLDDGTCTALGELCCTSEETALDIFIGTAAGSFLFCIAGGKAFALSITRGATSDKFLSPMWVSYSASDVNADPSAWRNACLAGSATTARNDTCLHGPATMQYPAQCNGTCGFDPRCQPWYAIHIAVWPPRTQMSDVYVDFLYGGALLTLSYPIWSKGSSRTLAGVVGTDFVFSDVEAYLATLGTAGVSQLVAVVLNNSALTVVGANRGCPNNLGRASGKPIAEACDPVLRGLSGWLAAHRAMPSNASLEVGGTVWDVFPDTVDSFSFFVAVGMNTSEVYATVTATEQAAQSTLQTLSQQQAARVAASEAAALAQMDAVSAEKIAALQATVADLQRYVEEVHVAAGQTLNASYQCGVADLGRLIGSELGAILKLQDYHLAQMARAVGVTFGAVVGVFVGVLLAGAYGTWRVTTQVRNITAAMEGVAHMHVEELHVKWKSSVHEVQRIEAALGVLVQRLAECKSYMPAALFQPDGEPAVGAPVPVFLEVGPTEGQSTLLLREAGTPQRGGPSEADRGRANASPLTNVNLATRLVRRSAAVMAVNVVAFQAEMVKRSAAHVEALLNSFISAVHRVASQAHGHLDLILGDQILVTFNAHFACSDPLIAASDVALELLELLSGDTTAPQHAQIGLAAGCVYAGHLGYGPFKSMLAVGAPLKMASLLAHLSGFTQSAIVVFPSVEERVKYSFALRPADLVALPALGDSLPLYAKSIPVHVLAARGSSSGGAQGSLYEAKEVVEDWETTFGLVARAPTIAQARAPLEAYLQRHAADPLALRLLARLPLWQPQVGVVLAERPDRLCEAPVASPAAESSSRYEPQKLVCAGRSTQVPLFPLSVPYSSSSTTPNL